MPIFRYDALDATGQSRTGELEATDATRATILLAEQSLVVLSIELVQPEEPGRVERQQAVEANRDDYKQSIDEVLRQPQELIDMLSALAEEPASAGLRKSLNYLIARLSRGVDATQFLQDERLCMWLPVVMSSRKASDVETRYTQLLSHIMEERARRRSLLATLAYPLFLVGLALLVLVPICVAIVPVFQKMYAEFGLRTPAMTKYLFFMADLVNQRPLLLILGLVLLIGLGALAVKAWVSQALTTRWLGWLIAGNGPSLIAMSRLTSILAELIELGVPVPEAMLLAGRASRHAYFREAAQKLAVHLAKPDAGWRASPVAHIFPLILLHALHVDEGQRPNCALVRELSQVYSQRVSARTGRGIGMISSPLTIVGVGMVVGFIVISLFIPLVSMVTSLT